MRRDPEAIRAVVSAIAAGLQAKHRQLLELLKELECQTPEIPKEVLEQREPPPLVFHFAQILQAAGQELGSAVEFLGRLVKLDAAVMAVRWREQRQRDFVSLVEATTTQLSIARDKIGQLAMCAPHGLSDEEMPGVAATLGRIREAARKMVEEDEEREEGRYEGEHPCPGRN